MFVEAEAVLIPGLAGTTLYSVETAAKSPLGTGAVRLKAPQDPGKGLKVYVDERSRDLRQALQLDLQRLCYVV